MTTRTRTSLRPALTLIEATIAMVVLSLVLVGVMQGVGLSAKFQYRTADELRGTVLAMELADRVAAYDYEDPSPDSPAPPIGRDSGESDAATYDDIDDWDGYTESPPTYADGSEMAFLAGWTRAVSVRWVSSSAPDTDAVADDGAKLITVVVTGAGGREVARVRRLVLEAGDLRGN